MKPNVTYREALRVAQMIAGDELPPSYRIERTWTHHNLYSPLGECLISQPCFPLPDELEAGRDVRRAAALRRIAREHYAQILSNPTKTPAMQTKNPLTQVTATVLQSKDPDIAPGTEVQVVGYTAIVPSIKRQAHIGAPKEQKDVAVTFEFSDLLLARSQHAAGPEGEWMPCCKYHVAPGKPSTIFWNPFNEVVQCHNCGQTFFSKSLVPAPTSPVSAPHPEKREKLPDTRPATTIKFNVGGQEGFITVGFYPDGRPGEVFVNVQRQGSTLQGFADAWARSLSMLLQYGVPVSELARMFAWHKFEPRGFTNNKQIGNATSIVDFVARLLGYMCVPGYQPGGAPVNEVPEIPDVTA